MNQVNRLFWRAGRWLPIAATPMAAAAERSVKAAPDLFSAGYIAQVLGSLAAVVLLLLGLVYLLNRVNRLSGTSSLPLKVLAAAKVGTREKVLLLAAGDRQLLLGVAPGSVRTLHVFDEPVVDPSQTSQAGDFGSLLRKNKARSPS